LFGPVLILVNVDEIHKRAIWSSVMKAPRGRPRGEERGAG
jgi:hypothetical protein